MTLGRGVVWIVGLSLTCFLWLAALALLPCSLLVGLIGRKLDDFPMIMDKLLKVSKRGDCKLLPPNFQIYQSASSFFLFAPSFAMLTFLRNDDDKNSDDTTFNHNDGNTEKCSALSYNDSNFNIHRCILNCSNQQ